MTIDLSSIDISLDDWENDMFSHLQQHEESLNDLEKPFYRSTTLFTVQLGRKLIDEGVENGRSLLDDELIDQLAMFNSRTQVFLRHWNFWIDQTWETEDGDLLSEYYTKPNMLHFFAPMYVQQLEGPLRYELSAFLDLVATLDEGSGNWKDYLYTSSGKKKFLDLMEQSIAKLDDISDTQGASNPQYALRILLQDDELIDDELIENAGIDYAPRINEIRNSFSHADYSIEHGDEDGYKVVINLHNDILRQPLDRIIQFILNQNLLMHYFSVGVSATIAKIALESQRVDYFMTIVESFTHNYPPKGEGTVSEEMRSIFEESADS